MPYVFVEELEEGQTEANVAPTSELESLQATLEELKGEAEEATKLYSALEAERDGLVKELADAKQKFADAFLSSSERVKNVQRDDVAKDSKPMTFEELFNERKRDDAH